MAYQLGGQEAYNIVGDAARQGTAPGGDQLDRLLEHVGPCVILMDELVAYVRNSGSASDSIYTFMQAFTQAVRRSDSCALVVTLPESAVEAGGEAGAEALSRLDSILGRIEAVWQPLEVHQAFEVVRRRLFGSTIDDAERDRTCEAFSRMYAGRARGDFPTEASEQRYLERMKECYPIHPEVFDRLYQDWSSIPRFQRTRGVLRMMANWISRLYLDNDNSPLVMPGDLRLSDPSLANEFVVLLDRQWAPVISEADSDGSRTDLLDRSMQSFAQVGGRCPAHRTHDIPRQFNRWRYSRYRYQAYPFGCSPAKTRYGHLRRRAQTNGWRPLLPVQCRRQVLLPRGREPQQGCRRPRWGCHRQGNRRTHCEQNTGRRRTPFRCRYMSRRLRRSVRRPFRSAGHPSA